MFLQRTPIYLIDSIRFPHLILPLQLIKGLTTKNIYRDYKTREIII